MFLPVLNAVESKLLQYVVEVYLHRRAARKGGAAVLMDAPNYFMAVLVAYAYENIAEGK